MNVFIKMRKLKVVKLKNKFKKENKCHNELVSLALQPNISKSLTYPTPEPNLAIVTQDAPNDAVLQITDGREKIFDPAYDDENDLVAV